MARDDELDREFSELENEIDAKVDSLFVEGGLVEEEAPAAEDDPWKALKEHFLTLEWEIDLEVLEEISQEAQKLQARYSDHPLSILLGWMAQVAERIRGKGADVDQPSMRVFHQLKDGLLRMAEDPFQDPQPIVEPLRERVLPFLEEEEEEAPTITIEAAEGEEDLLFAELDRAVDEALRFDEGEPASEMEALPQAAAAEEEQPAVLQETVIEGGLDQFAEVGEAAGRGAQEMTWEEETQWETPEPELSEGETAQVALGEEMAAVPEMPAAGALEEQVTEVSDLERIKGALAEGARKLQVHLEGLRDAEDPVGLTVLYEGVRKRLREFSQTMMEAVGSLQEAIRGLDGLHLEPPAPEPELAAEPERTHEEVLFVSVSHRIFGIAMHCVRGIFRMPSAAAKRAMQEQQVHLKGKAVPLIPLRKRLGLGRALYLPSTEEKRVVLVAAGTREMGLLVDQVLARQDVGLQPVEGDEHPLYRGRVTVEKGAFVVNVEAL
jgi:chemotaxis signal transduction protein